MSTAEAIEQLTKTMHGVDASRRAGWAQKFASDEKIEELSRLVNILSEQRDDLSRSLSWLYGLTMHFGKNDYDVVLFDALCNELADWEAVLDPDHIDRGHKSARSMDRGVGGKRSRQIKVMNQERAQKYAKKQRAIVQERFARYWRFESYADMHHFLRDLLGSPNSNPDYENDVIKAWAKAGESYGYPTEVNP